MLGKCKLLIKEKKQDPIMNLWSKIMYFNHMFAYERHLHNFELVCGNIPIFVDYVNQT